MPRYAALLRGVMPTNAKMPDLKNAFQSAGFTDVRTVLSSGNVAFTARAASEATLERRAEAAMARRLGQAFLCLVRSMDALRDLLAGDAYRALRGDPRVKRILAARLARPAHNVAVPSVSGEPRSEAYRPLLARHATLPSRARNRPGRLASL